MIVQYTRSAELRQKARLFELPVCKLNITFDSLRLVLMRELE